MRFFKWFYGAPLSGGFEIFTGRPLHKDFTLQIYQTGLLWRFLEGWHHIKGDSLISISSQRVSLVSRLSSACSEALQRFSTASTCHSHIAKSPVPNSISNDQTKKKESLTLERYPWITCKKNPKRCFNSSKIFLKHTRLSPSLLFFGDSDKTLQAPWSLKSLFKASPRSLAKSFWPTLHSPTRSPRRLPNLFPS